MAHATASAHEAPKPHYRQYWIIFVLLAVLTAVEIGVVYLPISKALIWASLIILAIVKAGLVGLYFMHLLHETMILRLTVVIPLTLPFLYAVVLIWEAWWRIAWRFMGSARLWEAVT